MSKENNRKCISPKRSLEVMEEILNKYNETLFKNKDTGEYKSLPTALKSIQLAWDKAFDKDRLQIMASIDSKEYIDKDNI
ncbi:hypothetical protein [Clostridium sp.]|uniref:hypothetical protein n=1 Tax=Clostridium sp. TaxID=1506 RepID=UPI0029118718|nr:hypothetical protein [Clostridium sp.]MDU3409995.1 hypothetical protein [Clostridium sp.]